MVQLNSYGTVTSDAFAGVPARVEALRITDAVAHPYEVHIDFVLEEPDFDVASILGRDVQITVRRAEVERRVTGLASSVTERGSRPDGTAVGLVVTPALALLALRRNTRMFQNKTVPEILEDVLGESLGPYGREARLELEETYDPREYCLQYAESDLEFVSRLMQEEGVAYRFEHTGDVEALVLVDTNEAYPDAPTRLGEGRLPYDRSASDLPDRESLHHFEREARSTTTHISVADFDWTQSPHPIAAEEAGEDALGRTRERYEHGQDHELRIGDYDEGARRYQVHDAERQALVRREEAVSTMLVAHAATNAIGVAPGQTVNVTGHPEVGADGEYLVISSALELRRPDDAGDEPGAYVNRFRCIPRSTTFRPPRRVARPVIHGVQTGVVTGPAGEEIHVDAHGRVKVRFHWDRQNPADETSSCWIRVKQEWAGAGWGHWWVPRIGMEVVVHFLDGHPDRPLVTGAVYDAAQLTPYPLPDEKTKSAIKSNSSLGGGGFNELRFEDKAGEEEIFAHAQKDYDEVVENDHTTTVHHDQSNTVDNDQTQTIGANQTERIDVDQTMTVAANRSVHVVGDFSETVAGTETRHTAGDVTETFAANETRDVGASVTETIGADETRSIGGSQSETIGASHTSTVGADSTLAVAGALTQSVAGGITTTTPASFDVSAAAGWNATAPGGIVMIAPAGAEFQVPGGVTRVDSFWEILAGEHAQKGTFQIEMFATKLGACGFAGGLWLGMKLDFCSSAAETNAVEMRQDASKARMQAIANEDGGPEANANATEPHA